MGATLLFGIEGFEVCSLFLDTLSGFFYDLRVDTGEDFLALGGVSHRGRVAGGVAKARGK